MRKEKEGEGGREGSERKKRGREKEEEREVKGERVGRERRKRGK